MLNELPQLAGSYGVYDVFPQTISFKNVFKLEASSNDKDNLIFYFVTSKKNRIAFKKWKE